MTFGKHGGVEIKNPGKRLREQVPKIFKKSVEDDSSSTSSSSTAVSGRSEKEKTPDPTKFQGKLSQVPDGNGGFRMIATPTITAANGSTLTDDILSPSAMAKDTHRMFNRKSFPNIDDDHYEAIKPALFVASKVLADPATCRALHAVLFEDVKIETNQNLANGVAHIMIPKPPKTSTDPDPIENKICKIFDGPFGRRISFTFGKVEEKEEDGHCDRSTFFKGSPRVVISRDVLNRIKTGRSNVSKSFSIVKKYHYCQYLAEILVRQIAYALWWGRVDSRSCIFKIVNSSTSVPTFKALCTVRSSRLLFGRKDHRPLPVDICGESSRCFKMAFANHLFGAEMALRPSPRYIHTATNQAKGGADWKVSSTHRADDQSMRYFTPDFWRQAKINSSTDDRAMWTPVDMADVYDASKVRIV